MPRPTLDGAVADAEDPAVAGQQPVAGRRSLVPQLQPGLQLVVVVARARVVGADGDAHRPVVALLQAHRQRQPAGVAVGGDDQRRAVGDARRPRCRLAVTPMMRPVRSSSTGPVTVVRSCSIAPALTAVPGEQVVEVQRGCAPGRSRGSSASSGQGSSSRMPPPMIRRPLLCSQPASSRVSMPIATSCLTARGVRPSPQTFSRGNAVFSSSSTSSAGLGQVVGGRRSRPGRRRRR